MTWFIWKPLMRLRKPTLADLPPAERTRARMMMWGAGTDLRPRSGEKTIRVEIVKSEGHGKERRE